ncbi:MAG: twin-arginine translocation signal domain-containing protein [Planctomycetota bacterium]|nr:MAG: twin-arginine translocation signal domain-containing protein [Planctomycetota bacterium]
MSRHWRRDFLKTSAAIGVAATTSYWTKRIVRAQESARPTVAAIGVGGSRGRYNRGGAIARAAAKFADMIAVCDVDDRHTAEFNQAFGGTLKTYRDYRDLFAEHRPDVVTIGTPDHWHVPIAIAALRAGCDVYCEKPLTLTVEEGREICRVVEETGRVFQVGTQQRSENNRLFLKAIALVQSGRLGKNVNAYVAIGGAPTCDPIPAEPVPEDLDWDMWVGPAQPADYSERRRKEFRWFYDYSGGKMTDWGAHHIDIAQWALGHDHSGPVRVRGTGQFPDIVPSDFDWVAYFAGQAQLPSAFNTATTFSIDLEYEDGSTISVHNHYRRESDNVDFGNGILFEGDAGRIFVNRGKLQGRPVDELTDQDNQELEELIVELYRGKQPGNHMGNFFECREDGSLPISDVFTHHRTMTACHLCNIALMTGRELRWDPKQERFLDDEQANRLLSRPRRPGYTA